MDDEVEEGSKSIIVTFVAITNRSLIEINVELDHFQLDPNAFVYGTAYQTTSIITSLENAIDETSDSTSLKASATLTKDLAGLLNISNT